MAFCTNCGKALEENEKFCSGCGTPTKTGSPKPPSEKEPEKPKYTKEGRKIIDAGPKPNHHRYTPPPRPPVSSTRKKKKRGFAGCLISALVIFAILAAGFFLIVNYANDWFDDITSGITQVEQEELEQALNEKKENRNLLNTKDTNSADKYHYGIDVEPDQLEAFKRYNTYAQQGDLNAMVKLSEYYEQGIWVEKNLQKARELLRQAAKEGSLEAQWELEYLENN